MPWPLRSPEGSSGGKVKSMVAAVAPWTAAVRPSSIRGKSWGPSMPRCIVILTLVLQAVFTRLAVSQDSLPNTRADSLRRASRLDGNWLRRLPTDDPRHVLVPGVRLTSADIGVTPGVALLIRGSAAARGNVYVDGAAMRFQTLGGAGVGL